MNKFDAIKRSDGLAADEELRKRHMDPTCRPDLSLNMPPEQSPIWCFGSFQVHFDGDRVEGFFAEFVSALDPGPGRTLDGWIFDSCTERSLNNIVAATVLVALGPKHILAGVSEHVTGKRCICLTRNHVAQFNTRVACRAARFVYYTGADFPFELDSRVVVGPTQWLKGDENDRRAGKKRGIIRVEQGRLRPT